MKTIHIKQDNQLQTNTLMLHSGYKMICTHCGLLERTTAKDGQQYTQPVRKVGVACMWEEEASSCVCLLNC